MMNRTHKKIKTRYNLFSVSFLESTQKQGTIIKFEKTAVNYMRKKENEEENYYFWLHKEKESQIVLLQYIFF